MTISIISREGSYPEPVFYWGGPDLLIDHLTYRAEAHPRTNAQVFSSSQCPISTYLNAINTHINNLRAVSVGFTQACLYMAGGVSHDLIFPDWLRAVSDAITNLSEGAVFSTNEADRGVASRRTLYTVTNLATSALKPWLMGTKPVYSYLVTCARCGSHAAPSIFRIGGDGCCVYTDSNGEVTYLS